MVYSSHLPPFFSSFEIPTVMNVCILSRVLCSLVQEEFLDLLGSLCQASLSSPHWSVHQNALVAFTAFAKVRMTSWHTNDCTLASAWRIADFKRFLYSIGRFINITHFQIVHLEFVHGSSRASASYFWSSCLSTVSLCTLSHQVTPYAEAVETKFMPQDLSEAVVAYLQQVSLMSNSFCLFHVLVFAAVHAFLFNPHALHCSNLHMFLHKIMKSECFHFKNHE